jgi:hypothetical protein
VLDDKEMSSQHQEEPPGARRNRVIYFLFGALVGAVFITRFFWHWDLPWQAKWGLVVIGASTLGWASARWGDSVWL